MSGARGGIIDRSLFSGSKSPPKQSPSAVGGAHPEARAQQASAERRADCFGGSSKG